MSSSWWPVNCCTASAGRGNARAARAREGEPDDAEPEPRANILERVDRMQKVRPNTRTHRARSPAWHPSTLRRWRCERCKRPQAHRANIALPAVPSGSCAICTGSSGRPRWAMRVAGLSRRQAARIKGATLTLLERERQASLTRISVDRCGPDPRTRCHASVDSERKVLRAHLRGCGDTVSHDGKLGRALRRGAGCAAHSNVTSPPTARRSSCALIGRARMTARS